MALTKGTITCNIVTRYYNNKYKFKYIFEKFTKFIKNNKLYG